MTHRLDVHHEPDDWTVDEWLLFSSPFGIGHLFEKQITGSYGLGNWLDPRFLGMAVAQDLAVASVGRAWLGAGAWRRAKSFARLGAGRAAFAAGPMGIVASLVVFEALSNTARPSVTRVEYQPFGPSGPTGTYKTFS